MFASSPDDFSPVVRAHGASSPRWRIVLTSVALSILVFALGACGVTTTPGGEVVPPVPTPTPKPTVVPACTTWSVIPSPNATKYQENALNAVNALSSTSAWAVGSNSQETGSSQHLSVRWDGTSWQIVPGQSENLVGVAAISATDVWAVGSTHEGLPEPYQTRALIEHWNGMAWSIVPSPNPDSQEYGLNGVVALSANDVWAVGSYLDLGAGARLPLIEHWNGTAWIIVTGPHLQGVHDSALQSVTRIPGTNELWAVGYMMKGPLPAFDQALIERWNGHGWMLVTPANPVNMTTSKLEGVVALSATDAWAVGSYVMAGSEVSRGLIEHWNGTVWQPVTTPQTAGIAPSQFVSVAAVGKRDVRAVGRYFVNSEGTGRALIAQWNGTAWSVQASPTPSGVTYSILMAIAGDGAGHYWAVGTFTSASRHQQTLILHCS
ncbi:MAG TPA: hypothetical protein VF040_00740 [Ktedonobacterales bacterium]